MWGIEALFTINGVLWECFPQCYCCRLYNVKICVSLQSRGFAVIELSSRLMPLAMNYAMSWEVIQQTTVFLAIRNFNPTRTSL